MNEKLLDLLMPIFQQHSEYIQLVILVEQDSEGKLKKVIDTLIVPASLDAPDLWALSYDDYAPVVVPLDKWYEYIVPALIDPEDDGFKVIDDSEKHVNNMLNDITLALQNSIDQA